MLRVFLDILYDVSYEPPGGKNLQVWAPLASITALTRGLPEQWAALVPLPDRRCPAASGNMQTPMILHLLAYCLPMSTFYVLTTFLPFLMPCVCVPFP